MDYTEVSGIVESITFYNKENGYCVFTIAGTGNDEYDELTCVGTVPSIAQGESISLKGRMVNHSTYGMQLNVESYEKTAPKTEKAMELYLASGVLKGIGPKTSAKIVKKFGIKTMDIIENEPERLAELRGITLEKAIAIGQTFREQAQLRALIMFLGQYGITPTYAIKVYQKYKDKAIDVISRNPYSLADDIIGIGFKIADGIAAKIGIAPDSAFRIKAGIRYCLNAAANNGNVYLPMEMLVRKVSELLNISPEPISNEMTGMHIANYIWIDRTPEYENVYLNYFYYAESYVARKLIELADMELDNTGLYDDKIDALAYSQGITFAKEQRLAIIESMSNGVLVITGGPGTGKTTIINAIIQLSEAEGMEVTLAAPTGRAAKRMEEATGHNAQTIHRLLGVTFLNEDSNRQTFCKNEEEPIETDILIIDESSMIDIMLMQALLKAVAIGTRVIIVGDSNQLPSVGAGNVLKDIITSGEIKVVQLTEIFRQAQKSDIIINAHKINKGEHPNLSKNGSDFFFMKRYNQNEICSLLVSLVTTRLPKYLNCKPTDIQVLTPMRKQGLGVASVNAILQQAINPPAPNKAEKVMKNMTFREGDKVMQIKNDYEMEWKLIRNNIVTDKGTGIYNGDEGFITYIDNDSKFMEVVFDENKVVHYDFAQLDKLELSYAVTIHKSQGSEYRAVILPLLNGPEMLMTRNLLYTGLTRAKNLAVIVGSPETVYNMVDNNREIERFTTLSKKIKEFAKL